jgi:hypothetical protein
LIAKGSATKFLTLAFNGISKKLSKRRDGLFVTAFFFGVAGGNSLLHARRCGGL